ARPAGTAGPVPPPAAPAAAGGAESRPRPAARARRDAEPSHPEVVQRFRFGTEARLCLVSAGFHSTFSPVTRITRMKISTGALAKALGMAGLAMTLLAACGEQNKDAEQAALVSGIDTSGMQTDVRPQDDFFRYVNGTWLETTEIPADKSNYGAFNALSDQAEADLRAIIEEAAASDAEPGSDMQKIGDYYAAFMDEATIEGLGMQPVEPFLAEIDALETHADVAGKMAEYLGLGIRIPVNEYVGADAKNSTQYALVLWQGGIGLPDRDYYLADDAKFAAIRDAYVA